MSKADMSIRRYDMIDNHLLTEENNRLKVDLATERERRKRETERADANFEEGERLLDANIKLRKALEPFVASAYRADSDDIADIDATYVVVAHLRRARAVLKETKGDGDE